jgi:hypothetical protein
MPGSAERARPAPAIAISLLALLISIGGTAYAAATIGTSDIQRGAVTTPKLARQAVKPGKLGVGAVTRPKLAADAVTSAKIQDGQVRAGDLGPITVVEETEQIVAGAGVSWPAACPAGTRLLGGGHSSPFLEVHNMTSQREGESWRVAFHNSAAVARSATAYAYCLAE